MTTIKDIVLDNSNGQGLGAFDILLQALLAIDPNETGVLGAAGDPNQDLTVFAPTDTAFINLAQVLDPTVITETDAVNALVAASAALSPTDDPTAFLRHVVSYHISPGEKSLTEVQNQSSISTLIDADIDPDGNALEDLAGGLPDPEFVGGLTDLGADNGVVHVIDEVLIPYDVTLASGGFLWTGRGDDAVVGSGNHDFILLGSGNDVAFGGADNDQIFGGRGNDVANGGDHNDLLSGGRGNDSLGGGNGHDKMFGGNGRDFMDGGADNDFLKGGRGRDTMLGGEGDDNVIGNGGADRLVGGSGNDTLKGGGGADAFVFNPNNLGTGGSMDEGHDVIRDFNLAQGDHLVLDMSSFDQTTIDTLAAADGDVNELELIDLLTAGVVTLGASTDGDLLIGHPAGTIELDGIPSTVDPAVLIPAVEFEFV